MKKENKTFKNIMKGTFVVGALMGASALSAATTTSLFDYEALGSGAEVRSELLHTSTSPLSNLDLNCGEKPAKESKAKTDTKAAEAKCGESCSDASCDAKDKDGKASKKATKAAKKTTSEAKSKDAKCGEATCGGAK